MADRNKTHPEIFGFSKSIEGKRSRDIFILKERGVNCCYQMRKRRNNERKLFLRRFNYGCGNRKY